MSLMDKPTLTRYWVKEHQLTGDELLTQEIYDDSDWVEVRIASDVDKVVAELQGWQKDELRLAITADKEGRTINADGHKRTVILLHELLTKYGFESCGKSREMTQEEIDERYGKSTGGK